MLSGMDAPSARPSLQFRRFGPCLLAICLGVTSHTVAAATYWQLQQSDITVFVEGDKDIAKRALGTTMRLQSAARWLLSWPDTYREPPVLVFAVNERLLRRTFQHPPEPPGAYTDATTGHGFSVRTQSLIVVTAPMGYQRRHELRSLQHAYGEALLLGEPSHDWPACVKVGMSILFAAAELTAPNHFYLSGEKVLGWNGAWNPERFLVPTNALDERMPQWERDQGGYSCYLLSFIIASATPEQRAALERMLTAVGRGVPLGAAATSELQQTLPEFLAHYGSFDLGFQEIRVDSPEELPVIPEPTPISAEELRVILGKLCGKLNNCRK